MKSRRGSHVGIILSFVIFITFVVFLYVVVQPAINTGQNKQSVLEYLEGKIAENVSANFTSTSVQIKSSKNPSTKCVILQSFLVPTEMMPPYIIIKNENGDMEEAHWNPSDFANLIINRKNSDEKFFEIYHSPEFDVLEEKTISSCTAISSSNYDISTITAEKSIFEKNIYELIDYYRDNYESLKNELKLPPGNEFSFGFVQSNGTVIEVTQGEVSTNVYAEEFPIQYINNQANIQSGFINLKVW
jgi:hypothetical protein